MTTLPRLVACVIVTCLTIAGRPGVVGSFNPAPQRDLVGKTFDARVKGVVDGDTIDVLRPNSQQVRVRLDGVDTPERGEPFTTDARNMTRVLAFDKLVTIKGRDVDSYGRLVARVVVGGKDVSVELVTAGLACFFRKYSSDQQLAAAEADAKSHARGFWARAAPKPACVARNAATPAATPLLAGATRFIGNVTSKVFHLPTCSNAGCKNCTRIFTSREEALQAGFRPAGDCIKAAWTPSID